MKVDSLSLFVKLLNPNGCSKRSLFPMCFGPISCFVAIDFTVYHPQLTYDLSCTSVQWTKRQHAVSYMQVFECASDR